MFSSRRPPPFKTIDASLENLEAIKRSLSGNYWEESDLPANDILRARFRAKYYGAKVITYRPFLEMVLEHSAKQKAKLRARSLQESPLPRNHQPFGEQYKDNIDVPRINDDATRLEDIDDPLIKEYARSGIHALIKSTTAFHGLGKPGEDRLIVTNVWGTAHA